MVAKIVNTGIKVAMQITATYKKEPWRGMGQDFLDPFLSVSGPKGPKGERGAVGRWKLRETVDATMFADPSLCLHMIGDVLSESGSSGLLRRERVLLLLSRIEEPLRRFSMRLGQDATLQVFCNIRKTICFGVTIQSCYPPSQNLLESSTLKLWKLPLNPILF